MQIYKFKLLKYCVTLDEMVLLLCMQRNNCYFFLLLNTLPQSGFHQCHIAMYDPNYFGANNEETNRDLILLYRLLIYVFFS